MYFELLRRGYDTSIGEIGNVDVDFVASNVNEKIYFQVTQTIAYEQTKERELRPMMQINDNYEKIILTMDRSFSNSIGDATITTEILDRLIHHCETCDSYRLSHRKSITH